MLSLAHYRQLRRLCLEQCLMFAQGLIGNKQIARKALGELRQIGFVYETAGMSDIRQRLYDKGYTPDDVDLFKDLLIVLERQGFKLTKE